MKKLETEQKWWSALSDWVDNTQGKADCLFVYDRQQGRLNRCFDQSIELRSVDGNTVSELYRAAAEGRLGMLHPDDMKPRLLTTEPEKLFAGGKEIPGAKQVRAVSEQPKTEGKEAGPRAEQKPNARRSERAAIDRAVSQRLREAETFYRQVVYAPGKPKDSAASAASGGDSVATMRKAEKSAALERTMDVIRNAAPLKIEGEFGREQEQLMMGLLHTELSAGELHEWDEERKEKENRAREELIAAQNMFIWAAASDKRDQEEFRVRMEYLDGLNKWMKLEELWAEDWQERMQNMSRDLYRMDLAGASESECNEKIRNYLDGRETPKGEEKEAAEAGAEDEFRMSNEMTGNMLRHFCRFAASEVPLSVRHVQVAEYCQKIVQDAAEKGISLEEMGLNPQERDVVVGTIEMGKLVERGLLAQAVLTSGRQPGSKQYRECLRDYLAMKGIEETLIPHVKTHREAINTGEGPASALQVLMANPGFSADDLCRKAGRTNALNRLTRMEPRKVAKMIRHGSRELAAMGRQVMIASYQPDGVRESETQSVQGQKTAQKGGPRI